MGITNKEETLDWLYRLRGEIYVFMPKEWIIPMNNALDLAIKALEQEPTTKNDLGVDCNNCKNNFHRGDGTSYCATGDGMCHYECEEILKNDLGVDCISRSQAQTEIEMNASRYTIARERGGMGQVEWSDQLIKVSDAVDIIRALPSVTPQEPRKGHWVHGEYCSECGCDVPAYIIDWKWQKDMDAKYCPNCGCRMVEPQESEGT